MNPKKIMVVFGTRPEAIKMAPVIKELKKNTQAFETKVIVTAQHREMLDQVLDVFQIKPDYDLNIMKANQSLSEITSEVLKGLEEVFLVEKPDMILVHGDTSTSFTAALAAYYHKIPIGHVEAGLRTYDKYFPFPEEANRQLIDSLADIYFVPTETTKNNLIKENKDIDKIFVTGNTAIDAIKYTQTLNVKNSILKSMNNGRQWILLTMHRRENHGEPMENVFKAIKQIVDENKNIEILMPVHLSPVVQTLATDLLFGHDRINLISPLEVDVFHQVLGQSHIVLTDSGGLQEEAPALNIPVLVLRDKTERPEGVESGTLKVIGTKEKKVYDEVSLLLNNNEIYKSMADAKNPYGDGTASQKIIEILLQYFYK